MKPLRDFFFKAFVSGFLLALPVYLAVLLMFKGMKSLGALLRPLTFLHPPGMSTDAAEGVLAVLVSLIICFILGALILTRPGRVIRERLERTFLVKIPGYTVVRGLTQQIAGQGRDDEWKPALADLGASTVLALIIEEVDEDRYAIFIPSAPSPFSGPLHILPKTRVHPLNVSPSQVFQTVSRWGSGMKDLVAAQTRSDMDIETLAEGSTPKKAA